MKTKFYIGLCILFLFCIQLKAQEYSPNESIGSQIKNNKVPGALYAPPAATNTTVGKGYEGSSLVKAYKEGKVEGLKFIFSPVPATTNATTNASKPLGLASEISAREAKATYDKAANVAQTQTNMVVPNLTQEEKKE